MNDLSCLPPSGSSPEAGRNFNDLSSVSALPATEQLLLHLISIIYEPVSTGFLTRCFASLDSALFEDRRPGGEEISEMVFRLRRKDFLNGKNQCPPILAELLTRQAISLNRFTLLAAFVEKAAPFDYMHGKWPTRCWRAMRQFRIGVYSQDFDKLDEASAFIEGGCHRYLNTEPPAVLVTVHAFDPVWLGSLPGSLQFYLLDSVVRYSLERLHHFPAILLYLEDEQALTVATDERVPFRRLLASSYLLQDTYLERMTHFL